MRFSLKMLLAAVAGLAICTAGLWYANIIWVAFFFTSTALLLMFGMLAAVIRRGSERAYWIGFAIFGVGYFVIAMMSERHFDKRVDTDIWNEPRLATTWFLAWLDSRISPIDEDVLGPVRDSNVDEFGRVFTFRGARIERFLYIGHSILTVLFALLGGWLGVWLYQRELAAHPGEPLDRS